MAGQADAVFDLVQRQADFAQNDTGIGLDVGTGRIEHRPVLIVHDLDAQSLGRQVEQQLVLELAQSRTGVDQSFELALEALQLGLLDALEIGLQPLQVDGLLFRFDVTLLHLPVSRRQILSAARDHGRRVAGAGAAAQRNLQGILKELRNAVQVALRGRAQQPHQEEEGHHRRDEVRVSDLPGAAMSAGATLLDLLYDDRLLGIVTHLRSPASRGQPYLPLRLLRSSSSSRNVGRSFEKSTLRPNSTATCGA